MSYETTEETLNDFFSECGEIVDVRIAMSVGGKSRGFAHVEFDSAESSAKACKLAGEEIDGRPVVFFIEVLSVTAPWARSGHRFRAPVREVTLGRPFGTSV